MRVQVDHQQEALEKEIVEERKKKRKEMRELK
jgi:hypothetical protein